MADKILATITSKGQITLPAQHRKAWGLKPGDQIAFDPPGGKSVRIEPRRKRSIFERLHEPKLGSLPRRKRLFRERNRSYRVGVDTHAILQIVSRGCGRAACCYSGIA